MHFVPLNSRCSAPFSPAECSIYFRVCPKLHAYTRERAAANGWMPDEYEIEMLLGMRNSGARDLGARWRESATMHAVRAQLVSLYHSTHWR
jgi:hypothetical protein